MDEKYTSRAAKMYRAQLNRLIGIKSEDDDTPLHGMDTGLEPIRSSSSSSMRNGTQTPTPLASEWVTPAQAKATVAAAEAEAAEANTHNPVAVEPSTPFSSATSRGGSSETTTSSSSSSSLPSSTTANIDNNKPNATLDISGAFADPFGSNSSNNSVKRPTIIGTGNSGNRGTGGLGLGGGGGKLGAKKLGAVKVNTSSFDFDKEDTPSSTASTSNSSLSTDAAMARTFARLDMQSSSSSSSSSLSTTTTSPKVTTATNSSTASGNNGGDFNKFKNAKAISSDMLFNSNNDAQAREDSARLATFSSARGISSDTFFGRGEQETSPGRSYLGGSSSSSNGGRYDGRAGSEGLGEFVDKLTSAAGDEVKRLAETMKDRASKVKEGLTIIADAVRR